MSVVCCLFAALGFQDATEAQKKEFLELLRKLPTKGEFYTQESVQKAKPYLPVLLSLTEKDIESIDDDLYPFVALSSGLSVDKENRVYVLRTLLKFVTRISKCFGQRCFLIPATCLRTL